MFFYKANRNFQLGTSVVFEKFYAHCLLNYAILIPYFAFLQPILFFPISITICSKANHHIKYFNKEKPWKCESIQMSSKNKSVMNYRWKRSLKIVQPNSHVLYLTITEKEPLEISWIANLLLLKVIWIFCLIYFYLIKLV